MAKKNLKIYGTTQVGAKGQVVIPKELRDLVGINPGDSVIFLVKNSKFIGILKNEDLQHLLDFAKDEGYVIS